MPGGCTPAADAGGATLLGEPTLKVTLEWDAEVTLREGEETVSRFFPAMANSLSSVNCDDMMGDGCWTIGCGDLTISQAFLVEWRCGWCRNVQKTSGVNEA